MQEKLKDQGKELYISLKENEADIRREMERIQAQSEWWNALLGAGDAACRRSDGGGKEILSDGKEKEKQLRREEEEFQKKADETQALLRKRRRQTVYSISWIRQRRRVPETGRAEGTVRGIKGAGGKRRAGGARQKPGGPGDPYEERTGSRRPGDRGASELKKEHDADEERLRNEVRKAEEKLAQEEPALQEQIVKLRELLPRYAVVRRLEQEMEKRTER